MEKVQLKFYNRWLLIIIILTQYIHRHTQRGHYLLYSLLYIKSGSRERHIYNTKWMFTFHIAYGKMFSLYIHVLHITFICDVCRSINWVQKWQNLCVNKKSRTIYSKKTCKREKWYINKIITVNIKEKDTRWMVEGTHVCNTFQLLLSKMRSRAHIQTGMKNLFVNLSLMHTER